MASDHHPIESPPMESRLILYHKHSSSGRTLFLRLDDTVCQFGGIPPESRVVESHVGGNQVRDDLSVSLTELLTDTAHRLGMPDDALAINQEFNVAIANATTPVQVYLARFTTLDPPADALADRDGRFIALTDARRLPPTELELLRLAYSAIMDDLS